MRLLSRLVSAIWERVVPWRTVRTEDGAELKMRPASPRMAAVFERDARPAFPENRIVREGDDVPTEGARARRRRRRLEQ